MKADEREIRRKRRILEHAVESGNVAKTCRYFGIPRSSFYRWHKVYLEHGEEGLRCKKPIAKSHPNQTPDEIVEKILYLRRKYHLGPVRIMLDTKWNVTNRRESTKCNRILLRMAIVNGTLVSRVASARWRCIDNVPFSCHAAFEQVPGHLTSIWMW